MSYCVWIEFVTEQAFWSHSNKFIYSFIPFHPGVSRNQFWFDTIDFRSDYILLYSATLFWLRGESEHYGNLYFGRFIKYLQQFLKKTLGGSYPPAHVTLLCLNYRPVWSLLSPCGKKGVVLSRSYIAAGREECTAPVIPKKWIFQMRIAINLRSERDGSLAFQSLLLQIP